MMARPLKEGVDYFPLDVHMDTKIELIEAEFDLKGFAVVVKLYQRIYGEFGYYCEWNDEVALLFSRQIGLGANAVSEIVNASIRRGIFDSNKFDKYGILTSSGIQKRYFEMVARRNIVNVKNEYLLVYVDQKNVNVSNKEANVCNNSKNDDRNTQSKVKESKEDKSKDITLSPQGDGGNKSLKSSETKAELKLIWESFVFTPCLKTAISSWIKYKIEKNQPYKPQGLKSLLTQIKKRTEKCGENAVIDLINECMANNWQGITWSKINGSATSDKPVQFKTAYERTLDTARDSIEKYKNGECMKIDI